MELIIDYMHDDTYRHMLNAATKEIFGFSFEEWYCNGCFEGEYIPFSYIEGGKILANASANIMKMSVNDKIMRFIQIGTVFTRPEFRKKGLARSLIEQILRTYKDKTDGFYLFGNLNAVKFYEKIGFQRQDQYQWVLKGRILPSEKKKFMKAGKESIPHYRYVLHHSKINAVLDQINRRSLQLFYTLDMENVFYCDEIDCFAVMHISDNTLYLDSVVSTQDLTIRDVLERITGEYDGAVMGFVPNSDQSLFDTKLFDGGDDYRLFYLGNELECVSREKLYFPLMSHA